MKSSTAKSGRGFRLALSDSRRLQGVIHSDGPRSAADIGAQPRTRCHVSALGTNRSHGSEIRAQCPASAFTPAQTGRRHPHRDGIARQLDIGVQPLPHCQTASDLKASSTTTASLSCWMFARSHAADSQPLPHCQQASDLKASSTTTASLSCWMFARSHARTATHRHVARADPWRVALLHSLRRDVTHTATASLSCWIYARGHARTATHRHLAPTAPVALLHRRRREVIQSEIGTRFPASAVRQP